MTQPTKNDVETGLARIKSAFANPKAKAMIGEVLPAMARKYLTPERITKIVLTAASRNPYLAVCTPQSVLRAIMEVAPLGLEIGGPQGHVYLVPFFNSRLAAYEAVPIPGYRGYIDTAYRTRMVKDILCEPVYEGDVFRLVRHGDDDDFTYEARYQSKDVTHFFCRARFTDGGHHIQIMTADEVEAVRQRSKAKDAGPWMTDPIEMGKKTCVKRARKYWPQNAEMATLAGLDDRVDTGEYIDPSRIIDAVPVEPTKPATDALADELLEGKTDDGAKTDPTPSPVSAGDGEGTDGPPTPDKAVDKKPSAKDNDKPRTDDEKIEYIRMALLDDANGDVTQATIMLAALTEFPNKDGKIVPGVERYEDLSPARLNILYGKVKKMTKDKEKKDNEKLPF